MAVFFNEAQPQFGRDIITTHFLTKRVFTMKTPPPPDAKKSDRPMAWIQTKFHESRGALIVESRLSDNNYILVPLLNHFGTDRQTHTYNDRQTDRQTGQKQYNPRSFDPGA
ncbi:hypothetical protein DPMN_154042 [Dreissena polymorpha]|uniref:Uncharacterized protein n=1 Tax=Dreissena polymorpha TaxID=45954 RepID=A0A9D4FJP5_DREPO|nr:hypothetical protein DPMN_154042 [Dreissena polymorpha]